MKKFVPVAKMSKKQQREYYKAKRKDWGSITPITRCSADNRVYNRAKEKSALRTERT